MLKDVALALSMYTMSCFKLSTTFCAKLESLMANFWWGQIAMKRKIH